MGETDDQLLALRDRTRTNLEATLQALKDAAETQGQRLPRSMPSVPVSALPSKSTTKFVKSSSSRHRPKPWK